MGGTVTSIEILQKMLEAEGKSPAGIFIDYEKCLGEDKCGKCSLTCPIVANCLGGSIRDEALPYFCIECQACMTVCPNGAIEIEGKPSLSPLSKENLSPETVTAIFKERRSCRVFKIDKKRERTRKLTLEEKTYLQRAFESSPIGHKNKYLRLVFIETPEVLKAISEACMESWFQMARFINLPVADMQFERILGAETYSLFSRMGAYVDEQRALYKIAERDPVTWLGNVVLITAPKKTEAMAEFEAGLATMVLMIAAASGLGLGTCISGVIKSMQGPAKGVLQQYGFDASGLDIVSALVIGEPAFKRQGVPTRDERPFDSI